MHASKRLYALAHHGGFTLIELMIVVAILGILAAIAVPAYHDYTCRAKLSEAIAAAGPARTGVSEYFLSQSELPAGAGWWATSMDTRFVRSVTWDTARQVVVVMGQGLSACGVADGAEVVVLSPITSTARVDWRCKKGSGIASKYLPAACQGS